MGVILERAIVGEPSPVGKNEECRALNVEFIRRKLEAALSATGAATVEMAEALRHGLDQAADRAETWKPEDLEPIEDLVTNLGDALRCAIEAQGLIPPHSRIFAALERYASAAD